MGYLTSRADVFPMSYTIMEAYVKPAFNLLPARDVDIVCTLRGGAFDPARGRVRGWVEEYGKANQLKFIAGEVNHASRYAYHRMPARFHYYCSIPRVVLLLLSTFLLLEY